MLNSRKEYIVAETGGNHEGDFDKVLGSLHPAVDAGVQAVKYQICTGETLVNRRKNPDDRFLMKWSPAMARCVDTKAFSNSTIHFIELLPPYLPGSMLLTD